MYIIYGLLQLVSNIIAWTMPPESQTKWQFIKLVQRLPLWAWAIGILLLTIGVMFEGSYRIYTRKTKEISIDYEAKRAAIESQFKEERKTFRTQKEHAQGEIASLNAQLREKEEFAHERSKQIREQLADLYTKGQDLQWGMRIHDVEKTRQFPLWLEEVKTFISQEPEFDKSHLARFKANPLAALDEFIKEFNDK